MPTLTEALHQIPTSEWGSILDGALTSTENMAFDPQYRFEELTARVERLEFLVAALAEKKTSEEAQKAISDLLFG